MTGHPTILAIEPSNLSIPYAYLSEHYTLHRVNTIMTALQKCSQASPPDLVLISSHFPLSECVKLLETLKNRSVKKLIPVIFVLDFSHRVIVLPGTSWAGQIGILHQYSNAAEIDATMARLLNPPPAPPPQDGDKMAEALHPTAELLTPTEPNEPNLVTTSKPGLKPLSYFAQLNRVEET